MNLASTSIVSAAAEYVRNLFRTTSKPSLFFHNYQHTESVVKACTDMAYHYELGEEDRTALIIAAWFHDTGYLSRPANDHEQGSVELVQSFIEKYEIPAEIGMKIISCIKATRMPQQPVTLIEKIICDADLFHLGLETYSEQSKALRQEVNAESGEIYGKEEWAAKNIRFLEAHHYFTDFSVQKLEAVKQNNLKKLRRKYPEEITIVRQQIKRNPELNGSKAEEIEKRIEEKNEKKLRAERPERGVETMFRTTSSNHLKLSEMADSKAHIMISVNSIILSVTISFLLRRLDQNPNFIIPTVLLVLVCIVAIIFAVLTTRPNVTSGTFVKEEILHQRPNLLFFGNFHKMSLEDYSWGMKELMNDREYLYGTMIKDIYSLGVVLAKKYRFLRISYNVFMFGLIAAVAAFGIATCFGPMRF